MYTSDDYLALNNPYRLVFEGSEAAEIFTKEIAESFDALIAKNLVIDGEYKGFVHSSVDGRPWTGTMWTRDVGNILRELVHYGYLGYSCMICEYLIRYCGINDKGFYSFPEYFEQGEVKSGDEFDGACAIIISFCLFLIKTETREEHLIKTVRGKIEDFLTRSNSAVWLLIKEIKENKLIAGTGEFGGGMGTEGAWCNVVQNHLALNALCACGKTLSGKISSAALDTTRVLIDNIKKYLIDDDGFIWCVSPKTLKPDPNCLAVDENVGFSGVNGCGAMMCDIEGDDAFNEYWAETGSEAAKKTFLRLLASKGRNEQFLKYGMYLQFETFCEGLLTSPSYGQGYALQLALNLNMLDLAEKLFDYLVYATVSPPPQYKLTRDSKYWFYERFLSPDYFKLPQKRQTITEGCGALNVVNVAEPLKIARQLAGLSKINSKQSPVKLSCINKVVVDTNPQ